MQIGTSTSLFYDQSLSGMTALSAQADKINTQISSTKRLQNTSDDVVAYQRLQTIARANADDTAYGASITLAQGLLDQADSTLGNVMTQIQQAQQLAVQAGNGTMTDANRADAATQLKTIVNQLVSLANTRDSRGQPLFGAATGDSAVTQAADGSVSFTGTGTPAAIPIADGQSIQATDSAQNVFGVTTAGGQTDVFAIINKLADALNAGGDVSGAIGEATDALNAAVTQISSAQASVGARGARLDLQAAQVKDAATNRETERSALEDTDIPTAVIQLQKTMTILQATQASFTRLSSLSLFDYLK